MKYLLISLLFVSCSGEAHSKRLFHFNEKVSFSDDFYGKCFGNIVSRNCGSNDCTYSIDAFCNGKKVQVVLWAEDIQSENK